MKIRLSCLLLAAASALLFPAGAPGQAIITDFRKDSPQTIKAFRSVVAKSSAATVQVQCDGKNVALGTIIAEDGWIVTKASELHGTITCTLRDGRIFAARVVGVHEPYDLALLRVEVDDLPIVDWRPSKETQVGKWVASAGLGPDPIAVGVISVARRTFHPMDQMPRFFLYRGLLGTMTGPAPGGGVKITTVSKGSSAEKDGLKNDDIITEAAGRVMTQPDDLQRLVERLRPGDVMFLKVKRAGKEMEMLVMLGSMPKGAVGNPQNLMGNEMNNRQGGFPTILQHDTVLKPHECGGPLVDLDGKVVGVNIVRAGRSESYAVPSEDVLALLDDLKSGKLAPPPDWLTVVSFRDRLPPDVVFRKEGLLTRAKAVVPAKPLPSKSGLFEWAMKKLEKAGPAATGPPTQIMEVKLQKGFAYGIEVHAREFNPILRLEDSAAKVLLANSGWFGQRTAQITYRPAADATFRLVVTTGTPDGIGSFTVTVRRTPTKPPEKKK